jgi:periplasmic divalent cation tolerance protein
MEPIVVFITAGSEEEAARVAEALLEQRLAACVHRLSGVASEFWWQGRREAAAETLLVAKTRRDLWPRLLEAVRAVHGYEVFEAIALPVVEGNPDYLRWIQENTGDRLPRAPSSSASSSSGPSP